TISLRDWSSDVCSSDLSLERRTQIWILSAAIPGIPTEVHVEVHEICKPLDLPGPGCLTARQISKWLKVDRYLTPGPQESMQEGRSEERRVGKERRDRVV